MQLLCITGLVVVLTSKLITIIIIILTILLYNVVLQALLVIRLEFPIKFFLAFQHPDRVLFAFSQRFYSKHLNAKRKETGTYFCPLL